MSTQPAAHLVRAIITHLSDDGAPWTSFSMVIMLSDAGAARRSFGYSFDGDGPAQAISTDSYEVRPAVRDYLASVYPDGAALPVGFMVQFDRDSGQYRIDFEDTDTARWQVTPANIDSVRESFRPRFE